MSPRRLPVPLLWGLITFTVAGCASPAPSSQTEPSAGTQAPGAAKTITFGVTGSVQAFSIATGGTPVGGWSSLSELHSDALLTSDTSSRRLVGRLAERAPSTDDGSITMLPDGRMRVVFALRSGVTWHDGAPFTAQDLVFSYTIGGPAGIPTPSLNEAVTHMAGVEAPDDRTFVVYYKEPYHLGATLGTTAFWPLPRHLLGEAYDRFVATRNAEEILNLSYLSLIHI